MYVYVIRWESRISDENESGNFNVCYADRDEAEAAMKKDYEKTLAEWTSAYKGDLVGSRMCDSGNFCEVHVDGDDYYDYHEWHIDELEVKN